MDKDIEIVFVAKNMVEIAFLEAVEQMLVDYRNGIIDLNDVI